MAAELSATFFLALLMYSGLGVIGIMIGAIRGGELWKVVSYFLLFSALGAFGFPFLLGVSESIIESVMGYGIL